VKKFLPLIGIILLIIYVVINLDLIKIKNAFLSINPVYIFIALLLTLPRVLIRNYAWRLIQEEQKIKLGYWKSLKIFLIGYFYGSFTPGYVGQLMRIPYMKEKTREPYGKLFVNSLIETIVHTSSLYIMILIGAILVVTRLNLYSELLYIIIIWITILIFILYYFVKKERGEKFFYTLIKLIIPIKLKYDFNKFVGTFYNDFPRVHRLIIPVIVSSFTWIIIFSQEFIFVIALSLPIPYIYFLLLFPVANVVGFIPITFAGIGTRELAAIAIFTTIFDVSGEDILVVSLLGFLITDVVTGLIGFFLSLTETRNKKMKV
jgi:uncharacterized protein (TIRG00374 family)